MYQLLNAICQTAQCGHDVKQHFGPPSQKGPCHAVMCQCAKFGAPHTAQWIATHPELGQTDVHVH